MLHHERVDTDRTLGSSSRAHSLCVLLLLLLSFSPLFGNTPARGSLEIAGSFKYHHIVVQDSENEEKKDTQGELEMNLGMGYFFTDAIELLCRYRWTATSYRREGDQYQQSWGHGNIYGVDGLLILNFPTDRAGVLFIGIGGGVSTSYSMNIEPVQFPIIEGGTRVLLGNSASLNILAYYERRRFDYGIEASSANAYGLKAGFSLFPLTFLEDRRDGK